MKKLLFLYLFLILIASYTLQGMVQKCPLCTLIIEYKNPHQALYNSDTCLFCQQKVNVKLPYKFFKAKNQAFRIHNTQELNCFSSIKNILTYNSTPLCDNCTEILSQLEQEKALFPEESSQDQPTSDDYKPIKRCHACVLI